MAASLKAQSPSVRPAAVAGMFYPGDPQTLNRELTRCLQEDRGGSKTDQSYKNSHLKAIIVPHAGYIYSGETAGFAYSKIATSSPTIKRVVLLGPAHRLAFRGVAVPSATLFSTPLGSIPVDQDAIKAIMDLSQIILSDAAHAQEHALEVQLPFLQKALGDFSIIPLTVGQASTHEVAQVINRLWGGDETLIVASSDLSHFHSYPVAKKIDDDTVSHILKLESTLNPEQACGALPINGLLEVAKQRGLQIECLAQCNSGDSTGDHSRVVGYASFALYELKLENTELGFALLKTARAAIATQFGLTTSIPPEHPAMQQAGATFVTLMLDGQLRGCIGTLEAYQPLGEDVWANASAAAFRDPRFTPVTQAEFARIQIEVSLLTPPEPIFFDSETDALKQLRPGVDGVILSFNHRSSTFLPQVWEQLPDAWQFMAHLKIKGGHAPDWWSPEIELFRYEVKKWKEQNPS